VTGPGHHPAAATRPLSVVLAGGGSAGHISPALALAARLRADDPAVRITALGTARGLETDLMPKAGIALELIPSVPLPRRFSLDLARVPGSVVGSVRAAGAALRRAHADVLVGFGSYVALPAYVAARRRGTPYVVHESNTPPGLGNRIGARFTPYVGVVDTRITLPNATVVGMPLRKEIRELDRAALRSSACERFGLDPALPTLLVTGGSQGARRLNDAALAALPAIADAEVQVLHIAGRGNDVTAADIPRGGPAYVLLPYVEEMELAYAATDFAVCRAGMNTVCEMTAVGMPAAYVPLPIGNGEQRYNAEPVVAAGGGLLVADELVTGEWIIDTVLPLMRADERLARMSSAAASLGRRDADAALAELVYRAAGR